MKSVIEEDVLVLNKSYEAINVISVKKAFVLICKDAAEVIETDGVISSKNWTMEIPSIIRLKSFNRVPKIPENFAKRKIYIRDQYICQYCSEQLTNRNVTVDHVLPSSRGGKNNWENLVTCCVSCNRKKGNRTPEEAGMKLISKPKDYFTNYRINLFKRKSRPKWEPYLFTHK